MSRNQFRESPQGRTGRRRATRLASALGCVGVLYEFDSAKKPSWSNLPVTMVPRNGLRLGELTKPQRAAALDALAAVLSKQGYQKVIDIMNADDQLVKGANKTRFGTENYYIALF